ncbi:unnamed protein product [Brachionus calyciflorus]|uniref:DDE-1 domain-containing protein n=1 Tax=Brachionus calyciflorus TaxID=104777 RepID=A0A814AHW5_9BILA|nr:unnamed protein product [Brachionus calyciflorus]
MLREVQNRNPDYPESTELKDFVPLYNILVVYNKAANFSSPVVRDQFFRRVYHPHLDRNNVCWFKSLKSKIKQYWNDWYINGEHSETAAGNLRSPGYVNLINWISEIWRNFDEDLIRDSFDSCGITNLDILDEIFIDDRDIFENEEENQQ